MSKTKRLVGLVVALVVVAGLVAGVALWSLGFGGSSSTLGLYVDGKKVEDPGTIVTIGSQDIPFSTYSYYYQNVKYSLSGGDDTYWEHDVDGSRASTLLETVDDYIRYYYSWTELARMYGIELTQDEIDEVDDQIQTLKDTYGSDFDALLADMGFASEETFREVSLMQVLSNNAMDAIEAIVIDENYDDILSGLMTVKHILVTDAYFIDETEADVEEGATPRTALEQAEDFAWEMLDMIRTSSDPVAQFEEFVAFYNEDPGAGENGYTFGEGVMVDEFYEGSKALAVGEFSDPVATAYGYHIIYRLPLDEALISADLYSYAYNEIEALINEIFESVYDNIEYIPGPYYAEITASNIK